MNTASRHVSRITCQIHHRLSHVVTQKLVDLGVHTILLESARSGRQVRRRRPLGLPGTSVRLDDAPVDVVRVSVQRDDADRVVRELVATGELDLPGHGSVYAQDITEYGGIEPLSSSATADALNRLQHDDGRSTASPSLLRDLSSITCVLSMPGSGRALSALALDLGTCVPIVTLGTGTGMRDRLGLLRVTVPPQKDIVHILAPKHDTEGIIRLLIEEGRLSQPGRGFLYYTPVSAGYLDTGLRVGPQDHAASVEQIIAAIDDLKNGTRWRRRFASLEPGAAGSPVSVMRDNQEIAMTCSEGKSEALIAAALEAGARGATTSRVRRLRESDAEGGSGARERSIITVPTRIGEPIVEALMKAADETNEQTIRVEVADCPAAFSRRASS